MCAAPDRRGCSEVAAPLTWLKADIKLKLLERAEIYCLSLPLSLTCCENTDDKRAIVIGQGLIDLIAFRVCSSSFEAMFPLDMAGYTLAGRRTDMSALEMLSNALVLLGCQLWICPLHGSGLGTDMTSCC